MPARVTAAQARKVAVALGLTPRGTPRKKARPRTGTGQSESALVRQILDWLKLQGILAWRNQSHPVPGRRFTGLRGVSDIIGILDAPQGLPGKFLAIECKVGRNRLRPEQTAFLNEVHRRGGIAIVAYGLGDVIQRLG